MASFDPNNVTMLEALADKVPYELGAPIIKDIISKSTVMQLAKPIKMNKTVVKFPVLKKGLSGYRVAEGERIRTSAPEWTEREMQAWKIGVIIPVTREYLNYKAPEFFATMRPLIADAFYKKFDSEALFGDQGHFSTSTPSIKLALEQAGIDHTAEAALDVTAFDKALDVLGDKGYVPNAVLSKIANTSKLRGMARKANGITTPLYDKTTQTLDGLPIVNISKDIPDFLTGSLILGDFDQCVYGIPYNMHYMISQDATLTTVTSKEPKVPGQLPDGNMDTVPLNLFEREMAALRVTMDVAFEVISPEAFYLIKPAAGTTGK